ncbi:MAG: GDP-L-fucose synthase [Magnetococcales bacterium]|nr:GDP-L-fucose synthase [Magnetococcales bacterium]
MQTTDTIYVAGHSGLIGSAVVRRLQRQGFQRLLLARHAELELTDPLAVARFFAEQRPDYVVLAAGRVGGIIENQSFPADFIRTNLAIQLNVLQAAHDTGVQKLILFGSSCMYPRQCPQPMAETALLSGHPEPTSLPYAVAKLAGVHLCLAYNRQYGHQRFIPLIPNSAFGPNDNFQESGHVLSALIRRFHAARQSNAPSVTLWGSGTPRREFIHADDIADACLALLNGETDALPLPLNLGSGQDYSIRELALAIAQVVGYTGTLQWDTSKPDGAPQKWLDSSRLRAFGWQPTVTLTEGLRSTYQWYLDHLGTTEGGA